jgi:hypothetical protein
MNCASFTRLAPIRAVIGVACAFAVALSAQTTDSPPAKAETSRLQQMENTYQLNLRKLHAPLLTDYLRDLERLRQSYIAKDHPLEAKKVEDEIAKVKKLSATTGTFDFTPPKKDQPPPPPPALAKLKRLAANTITLLAAEATVTSANSTAIVKDSRGKAILLGQATWKNVSIPAGTYEILAVRASAKIEAPRVLTFTIADHAVTCPLQPSDATKDDDSFRLLHIGTLTLETDLNDASVSLQLDKPENPIFWLRSLVIAKPKPKP